MHVIPFIKFQGVQLFQNFLNSLNCSGFFFGTGNVLEKIHFFRIVLELFLNSEFFTINFLGYNFSGCSLFGSPICNKILNSA